MTATQNQSSKNGERRLYVSFELGWSQWKLAFCSAAADPARVRAIGARNMDALRQELVKAKERFGLPTDAPVYSCYEAGRDGFWLHRWLSAEGIDNVVVDSASIETPRRGRRAKNDRLDAVKLVSMLVRYQGGEKKVWKVVHVPSGEDEDRRQLHRDLLELKAERTQHSNRIKGLLAAVGLAVEVGPKFLQQLPELRTWDQQAVPAGLQERLQREFARWEFVDKQIKALEKERVGKIRTEETAPVKRVRQLLELRGIGTNSAWLYVMEFFGWRDLRNRREVAALAGLTPTPYQSGDSDHEQGISKAGNRRLRSMAIEIAWCWLQYQPGSALSHWYQQRYGPGKSRLRRIGIVALARKLLVALWRYLETGEAPQGAKLVDWHTKVGGAAAVSA
jgi:transposase